MDGGRTALTTALWRSFRNGDFEEEDVWNVLNEKSKTTSYHSSFPTDSSIMESPFLPSASRMIPRPNGGVGAQIGSIPQWSKTERRKNPRNRKRVPPHELIAKRLARAQISSFSVFEGAGRTLKGRDLSKVRNAVLTKTGFLESL
ncbi:hypothetical protein Csa_016442 [Cucumis sativus]|nr:hypothetical protein Csa_016442 [Cucumis sativus]